MTACEWQIGVNETEGWVLSTGNALGREAEKKNLCKGSLGPQSSNAGM